MYSETLGRGVVAEVPNGHRLQSPGNRHTYYVRLYYNVV